MNLTVQAGPFVTAIKLAAAALDRHGDGTLHLCAWASATAPRITLDGASITARHITEVPAVIDKGGEVYLQASMLTRISAAFQGEVRLQLNKQGRLDIQWETGAFCLPTADKQVALEPLGGGTDGEMHLSGKDAAWLAEGMMALKHGVAGMDGVEVDGDGGTFWFIRKGHNAWGQRGVAGVYDGDAPAPNLMLPPVALPILAACDPDDEVTLAWGDNHWQFISGPHTWWWLAMTGTIPDISATFTDKVVCSVDADALRKAIDQVGLIDVSKRGTILGTTLRPIGTEAAQLSLGGGGGDGSSRVKASYTTKEPPSVKFWGPYLTPILKAMSGDVDLCWLEEPGNPINLRSHPDERFVVARIV